MSCLVTYGARYVAVLLILPIFILFFILDVDGVKIDSPVDWVGGAVAEWGKYPRGYCSALVFFDARRYSTLMHGSIILTKISMTVYGSHSSWLYTVSVFHGEDASLG